MRFCDGKIRSRISTFVNLPGRKAVGAAAAAAAAAEQASTAARLSCPTAPLVPAAPGESTAAAVEGTEEVLLLVGGRTPTAEDRGL